VLLALGGSIRIQGALVLALRMPNVVTRRHDGNGRIPRPARCWRH
jgi:hypothetical protein